MSRLPSIMVCALLAISVLAGSMSASAADPYTLSFEDPVDYPENLDADLKSLVSYVDGKCVVVELATYGGISAEPGYSYGFTKHYSFVNDDPISFSFYYSDGNGTFDWFDGGADFYDPNSMVQLTDIWEIVNGTLVVRIPGQYAGSPGGFNLTASSNYFPQDGTYDYAWDSINEQDYPFYDTYDFDNAEPLAVPASLSDSLDEGESKVYSMDLEAGAGVLITLNGGLGDWPSITVFDSNESHVTSSYSMTRDVRMTFVPQTPGTYYLAIDSWSVTGSYKLTTSFRGLSGAAYSPAAPPEVPWHSGDEWSMGGYISVEDLMGQMLDEAGMAGIAYSMLFSGLETDGGIADFLVVTYIGEETGRHRFDFRSRIYCDMTLNMTMVTGSSSYVDDEFVGEYTDTMYMNTSGIVDIDYTGSIWLGYYESADGTGYWGAERETLDMAGAMDVYAGTSSTATYSGMEDVHYEYEMRMAGTMDLALETVNEPGIPFLPSGESPLSVDKKSSTTYGGSLDVDMWTEYMYSDMEEYPDYEQEDMNETFDCDFNGSYVGYHVLEYDPGTRTAQTTPLLTDPFSFIMMAVSGTSFYGEEAQAYPYWLDYGTSEATYDMKSGFYTTFEMPLDPLGGTAMSLGGEGGGDTTVQSLGILGALSGLVMRDTSGGDAEAFFEDPAGYVGRMENVDNSPATILAIAIFVAVIGTVVATVALTRKRKSPPIEPGAMPPRANP